MPDLEQLWRNLLDDASLKAVNSGRSDVAEFLRLKLSNDTIRNEGVNWLFTTLTELAVELQRSHNVTVFRTSPHSFKYGLSNMVGVLMDIKHGVRCFSVEAGWVRTPSDGVMRDGALARARFRHFGIPSETAEYKLIQNNPLPIWVTDKGDELHIDHLRRHLALLVED